MKILIKVLLVFGLASGVAFGSDDPLLQAVTDNDASEIRRLLKQGADPYKYTGSGLANLMGLANYRYPGEQADGLDSSLVDFWLKSAGKLPDDVGRRLISHWVGHAIDMCDNGISNPLSHMMSTGVPTTIKVLGKHCANPAGYKDGEAPLDRIRASRSDRVERYAGRGVACLDKAESMLKEATANHASCKPPTSSGSTASTGGSGGGSTGGSGSTSGSGSGTSSTGMRWVLTDECADSGALQARFFSFKGSSDTPSGAWPDYATVYTTDNSKTTGDTIDVTLNVAGLSKVCYGAELENDDDYWGIGLQGTEECTGCCAKAEPGVTVRKGLTCNN